MFKVPENTTVRFYTIAGRAMFGHDALNIVSGTLDPRSEQVFEAGESCPNMTLQSERDDSTGSAAELKQKNDDNAKAARARGDDVLQVDQDTTLESIVRARPGFDYAWTCCYDYKLKAVDGSETPVNAYGIGTYHALENGGNKILMTYERRGAAGGWDETRLRRTYVADVVGRIEAAEMLESGNALALQLLLTDETKNVRNKFKSYTVFVKTDILKKSAYFDATPLKRLANMPHVDSIIFRERNSQLCAPTILIRRRSLSSSISLARSRSPNDCSERIVHR